MIDRVGEKMKGTICEGRSHCPTRADIEFIYAPKNNDKRNEGYQLHV